MSNIIFGLFFSVGYLKAADPSRITLTLSTSPVNSNYKVDIVGVGGQAGSTDTAQVVQQSQATISAQSTDSNNHFIKWEKTNGDCAVLGEASENTSINMGTQNCSVKAIFGDSTSPAPIPTPTPTPTPTPNPNPNPNPGGTNQVSLGVRADPFNTNGLNIEIESQGKKPQDTITVVKNREIQIKYFNTNSQYKFTTWKSDSRSCALSNPSTPTTTVTVGENCAVEAVFERIEDGVFRAKFVYDANRDRETVDILTASGGSIGGSPDIQDEVGYDSSARQEFLIKVEFKDELMQRYARPFFSTRDDCALQRADSDPFSAKVSIPAGSKECRVEVNYYVINMPDADFIVSVKYGAINIEGAEIIIARQDNGQTQRQTTDQLGYANFQGVDPSVSGYNLKIIKEGYQIYTDNIDSIYNSHLTIPDSSLLYSAVLQPLDNFTPPGMVGFNAAPENIFGQSTHKHRISIYKDNALIEEKILDQNTATDIYNVGMISLSPGEYKIITRLISFDLNRYFEPAEHSFNNIVVKSGEETPVEISYQRSGTNSQAILGIFTTLLEDGSPLPGVDIYEKDSRDEHIIGVTDINGQLITELSTLPPLAGVNIYSAKSSILFESSSELSFDIRSAMRHNILEKIFSPFIRHSADDCTEIHGIKVCFIGREAKIMRNDAQYQPAFQAIANKLVSLRRQFNAPKCPSQLNIISSNENNAYYNSENGHIEFTRRKIRNEFWQSDGVNSLKNITTHEFGHCLDDIKIDNQYGEKWITFATNQAWWWNDRWVWLSKYYKIVTDCYYTYPNNKCDDEIANPITHFKYHVSGGHPETNVREFFASNFKITVDHEAKYRQKISEEVLIEHPKKYFYEMIDKVKSYQNK